MDNLPNNTTFLVLERIDDKKFNLWYRTNDEGLLTISSRAPLVVGGWYIRDGAKLSPVPSQPFNTCIMLRKNVQMLRLSTVVVRPMPTFFDTDKGQLKRKFIKYLGVSCEFGTVFVTENLLEQMEYGVPYEMLVASFGICHLPEDELTLKAMKLMRTIWLATRQKLVRAQIPDEKLFIERIKNEGVELLSSPDMRSPCRPGTSSPHQVEDTASTVPNGDVPTPNGAVSDETHFEPSTNTSEEVHPVNETVNDIVWSEQSPPETCPEQPRNKIQVPFDSEEGKGRTRACLEKVLGNLRICNAFVDAGFAAHLAALRAIMPPVDR